MSIEFTKIVISGPIETQYRDILNELVHDTKDSADYMLTASEDKQIERLLYLISKYSFFIHYLQTKEEYEKCTEMTKFTKVLGSMYGFTKEHIGNLITSSITMYNEAQDEQNN